MRGRPTWRGVLLMILMGMLLASLAGCSDDGEGAEDAEPPAVVSDVTITDDALVEAAASLWLNQLGLSQTDVSLWRSRLQGACREGVWKEHVAHELAARYIADDLGTSIRDPRTGVPSAEEGAQVLWLMAVQVCRDSFPPGAVEAGPPSG